MWTEPESWFFRKEEAIMGAMGDLGVHKSDFIRYLLNDEVSEVAGFISTLHKEGTKVDDNATCLLRMKSGAIGTLVASLDTIQSLETTVQCCGARMVL